MEYNPQTFNYESVKTGIESKFGLGPSSQSSNSARVSSCGQFHFLDALDITFRSKISLDSNCLLSRPDPPPPPPPQKKKKKKKKKIIIIN